MLLGVPGEPGITVSGVAGVPEITVSGMPGPPTDGGNHWQVWNAEKDLAGWRYANYGLIKEVELQPNGAGKLILSPITGHPGEVPVLVTSDFGAHWRPPQSHD